MMDGVADTDATVRELEAAIHIAESAERTECRVLARFHSEARLFEEECAEARVAHLELDPDSDGLVDAGARAAAARDGAQTSLQALEVELARTRDVCAELKVQHGAATACEPRLHESVAVCAGASTCDAALQAVSLHGAGSASWGPCAAAACAEEILDGKVHPGMCDWLYTLPRRAAIDVLSAVLALTPTPTQCSAELARLLESEGIDVADAVVSGKDLWVPVLVDLEREVKTRRAVIAELHERLSSLRRLERLGALKTDMRRANELAGLRRDIRAQTDLFLHRGVDEQPTYLAPPLPCLVPEVLPAQPREHAERLANTAARLAREARHLRQEQRRPIAADASHAPLCVEAHALRTVLRRQEAALAEAELSLDEICPERNSPSRCSGKRASWKDHGHPPEAERAKLAAMLQKPRGPCGQRQLGSTDGHLGFSPPPRQPGSSLWASRSPKGSASPPQAEVGRPVAHRRQHSTPVVRRAGCDSSGSGHGPRGFAWPTSSPPRER